MGLFGDIGDGLDQVLAVAEALVEAVPDVPEQAHQPSPPCPPAPPCWAASARASGEGPKVVSRYWSYCSSETPARLCRFSGFSPMGPRVWEVITSRPASFHPCSLVVRAWS